MLILNLTADCHVVGIVAKTCLSLLSQIVIEFIDLVLERFTEVFERDYNDRYIIERFLCN